MTICICWEEGVRSDIRMRVFYSSQTTDNALDRQVERGEGATVHRFLGL